MEKSNRIKVKQNYPDQNSRIRIVNYYLTQIQQKIVFFSKKALKAFDFVLRIINENILLKINEKYENIDPEITEVELMYKVVGKTVDKDSVKECGDIGSGIVLVYQNKEIWLGSEYIVSVLTFVGDLYRNLHQFGTHKLNSTPLISPSVSPITISTLLPSLSSYDSLSLLYYSIGSSISFSNLHSNSTPRLKNGISLTTFYAEINDDLTRGLNLKKKKQNFTFLTVLSFSFWEALL